MWPPATCQPALCLLLVAPASLRLWQGPGLRASPAHRSNLVDETAARASAPGLAAKASAPGLAAVAAMLRVQVHQQVCVPCPASGEQVWDAVGAALGMRRIEFDLLVGNDPVPYSGEGRWWKAQELDVTVVKRPPDFIAGLEVLERYWSGNPGDWSMQLHSFDFFKCAVAFFCGDILACASPQLRACREAVLFAVKNCGSSLLYANSELRDDRDVVKAAVQSWGGALEFASERLKDDAELVCLAIADDAMHGQWGTKRARNQLLDEGRIVRFEPPERSPTMEADGDEADADDEAL